MGLDLHHLKRLIILFTVPVLFTLGGGYILWHGIQNHRAGTAAKSWPAVTGEVVTSTVIQDPDSDDVSFLATVSYNYTVDSVVYSNDTIYAGYGGSYSKQTAQDLADLYPVGEPVSVLYNPEDPGTAVLQPGTGFSTFLTIAMSLPFLLIGAALLRHFPEEWRSRR